MLWATQINLVFCFFELRAQLDKGKLVLIHSCWGHHINAQRSSGGGGGGGRVQQGGFTHRYDCVPWMQHELLARASSKIDDDTLN